MQLTNSHQAYIYCIVQCHEFFYFSSFSQIIFPQPLSIVLPKFQKFAKIFATQRATLLPTTLLVNGKIVGVVDTEQIYCDRYTVHPGTDVTAGGKFNSSVNDTCDMWTICRRRQCNGTDSAL